MLIEESEKKKQIRLWRNYLATWSIWPILSTPKPAEYTLSASAIGHLIHYMTFWLIKLTAVNLRIHIYKSMFSDHSVERLDNNYRKKKKTYKKHKLMEAKVHTPE